MMPLDLYLWAGFLIVVLPVGVLVQL